MQCNIFYFQQNNLPNLFNFILCIWVEIGVVLQFNLCISILLKYTSSKNNRNNKNQQRHNIVLSILPTCLIVQKMNKSISTSSHSVFFIANLVISFYCLLLAIYINLYGFIYYLQSIFWNLLVPRWLSPFLIFFFINYNV